MLKSALFFPLLTLALTAQTAAPTSKKATKKAAPAAKKTAPAAKEDPILALIGEKAIHQSDFETFLELAVPASQRSIVMASPDMVEQYRKRFLDFCVLAAKARHEKLDTTPAFQKKLALRGQETLVQELMHRDGEALQKQAQPTDEAVKAYFESHKDKFTIHEKYSVRHILIGTKEGGTEKGLSDAEAKAKAEKVLAEIKGGKKLQDLVKQYSDDPGSKENGGLYENISYGQFVPEFEAAVKKQAPGEVSAPVKTQFGYHLIQVEKKTPAVTPEFDTVKEKVKQTYTPLRQEEVFRNYVDEAKKSVHYVEKAAPAAKRAEKKETAK